MIKLTRLNGEAFYLNPALIETVKESPDTTMRLTTDKTLIVKEKPTEIVKRIVAYNRNIFLEKVRTS